jgi:dTDP-4-dehydrorhamnose 3,5-epimerase
MRFIATEIADVKIVEAVRHGDERGYFSETYNRRAFAAAGIDLDFVQDNHSLSRPAGTIRGLHFQLAPFAQDKLVRVVRGAILDVAVDLRRGSPTYGRHVAATLRAGDPRQLLVPIGFAHGFCTLEPDTEVIYKVTNYYSAPHDRGILWNDPALGIAWPVTGQDATLSPKDRHQPLLRDIEPPF